MEAAGLTAGGFYSHFESKQALLAETLVHAAAHAEGRREKGLEGVSGFAKAEAFIDRYLSAEHRRKTEDGCPLPALVSETSRSAEPVKKSFEAIVRDFDAWLACCAGAGLPEDRRLAIIALCVGGIGIARSVQDESFGERVLAACRGLAKEGLKFGAEAIAPNPAPT
jgi:TetR/AcrR family transcriptional repressor of nem operon